MTQAERDARTERAHGGIIHRDGDMATLGDGACWWLNGQPWARAAADAAIAADRTISRTQIRA